MANPKVEQRLAAILAADVAGYSRLMGADERATIATLGEYRDVFRKEVEANQGRVVDMAGDSLLAIFNSAIGAVRAAAEAQGELAKRNEGLPDHRRMLFRVGVNLGDIQEAEDGKIYGDGVNVAARLEALANPGGINISGSVFDSVRSKLGLTFDYLGEREVKNIADPVRAYRVVGAGAVAEPTQRAASADQTPSVAVLAFENMSTDPEQEYFSDGITEDIITELSKLSGLRIIARNSSFVYKGGSVDLRQVSTELGVRYVLEGSVRKAGQRVRINAQLIDGSDGSHVWADRYDRDLADIFAIQDEVTGEIVKALRVRLVGDDQTRTRARGTTNSEAYDLYLRARTYPSTPDGLATARPLLSQALALDPNFANARVALAHNFLIAHEFGAAADSDDLARAESEAELALKALPGLAAAHYAKAKVLYYRDDHDGFRREAAVARKLSPNSATMLADFGRLTAFGLDRLKEGAELARQAVALNPRHPGWYLWPIMFELLVAGRTADALQQLLLIDQPRVWRVSWECIVKALLDSPDKAAAYQALMRAYPDYTYAWAQSVMHYGPSLNDQVRAWHEQAGLPLGEGTN